MRKNWMWLGLALSLAIASPSAEAQGGQWINLPPFPEPHEEVIGQGANGKMYVFAGLVSAPVWLPVGMVYEYDPPASKWTKKKPMALPAHHLALTELNGKIYVFGGFTEGKIGNLAAWTPIDNAFEYDPVNDSWKALAPMPTKRGAAVAATVGGKMYVIGGATTAPGATNPAIHPTVAQRVLSTVEEYDPEKNTWRERASMPTPRNHTAAGAINGKIYVVGGRVGAAFIGLASDISVVEEYDPATDKWAAPRSRMPTARSALGSGVYNGRMYIAGGEFQDPHMMATFRSVEAYEPATDTWSIMPPMPVSRHGLAAGMIGNRFILVGGDIQSSGTGIMASTGEVDALILPEH